MPQAIPAVAGFLGATAFTVGSVAVTWGTLASVAFTAGSVAYSANRTRKMKRRAASLKEQGRSFMLREPTGPRMVIYGTTKIGGNMVFAHTTGNDREFVHVIIAHAGHECNAINKVWFGEEEVPLDGSGNATGFYADHIRVKKYLGTSSQSVGSGTLTVEAAGIWTSNHRLRGICCTEWRLKWNAEKFPSGLQNLAALVEGKKVYDPRTGTTYFSSNPALIIRDYLTNPIYGMGCTDDEIDDDLIIEAANICDEDVSVATTFTRQCDVDSGNNLIGMTTQSVSELSGIFVGQRVSGAGIPAGAYVTFVHTKGPDYYFALSANPTATNYDTELTFGDVEYRYTCNGVVDTSVQPSDNLQALLSSMAGSAVYSGGKWRVYAGAHRASSGSITLDQLVAPVQVQTAASRRDTCNAVKGIFVSEKTNWQPADLPPIRNGMYEVEDGMQSRTFTANDTTDVLTLASAVNLAEQNACRLTTTGTLPAGLATGTTYYVIPVSSTTIKLATTRANAIAGTAINITDTGTGTHTVRFGEVIWRDIELPFTTASAMGQRLEKIELERTRQDIACTLSTNLSGLKYRAGDVVALPFERYGWDSGGGKLFEIVEHRIVVDTVNEAPFIRCDLALRETAEGVWDWNSGEETEVDLAPDTDLPDPWTVQPPTDLTLTSGAATVLLQPDGTASPRLLVEWTAPEDQFVLSGGHIRIQYRVVGAPDWSDWKTVKGDVESDYITNVLIGTAYEVQVRAENTLGAASDWVVPDPASHTVVGDQTAPDGVGTLTIVVGSGKALSLDWPDNTDADLREYAVYRSTTSSSTGFTKVAEISGSRFVDVHVDIGTQYWYYVVAIDGSENEGDPSNVVTGTPVEVTATVHISGEQVFKYLAGSATPTQTSITLTATLGGGLTTYDWEYWNGSAWENLSGTNTNSTYSLAHNNAAWGSATTLRVRCVSGPESDEMTIVKVSDGEDGVPGDDGDPGDDAVVGFLTNEAHVLPSDAAGTVSDWSGAVTEFKIFIGTTDNSASWTLSKTDNNTTSNIVGRTVTVTAMSDDMGYVDITAARSGFTSIVKRFSVSKSRVGIEPAPSSPSAPTFNSDGTYTSGDGTAFAWIKLNLPSMPSGAALMNVLYRRNGSTGWIVADQKTSGGSTATVDDLTPGQDYEFAVQAFSMDGQGSSIVGATGDPFTAPTSTTTPNAPTSLSLVGPNSTYIPPRYQGGAQAFVARLSWARSTSPQVTHYEIGTSSSTGSQPGSVFARTSDTFYDYATTSTFVTYFWVRSKDRIGNVSAWTLCATQLTTVQALSAGDLSEQDRDDATLTGVTTGDGSSTTKVLTRYIGSASVSLTGGSPSENFDISLSNRGFGAKPDSGVLSTIDPLYLAVYHIASASSTSTNARCTIRSTDGSNIPTTTTPISFIFEEHD